MRRTYSLALACLAFAAAACTSVPKHATVPAVSGAPVIADTVTTSLGSWKYRPTRYAYHWEDCARKTFCTMISGATSKSYTVRASDFYYNIRSEVTACNAKSCSSAFSSPTAKVTGVRPSGVGLPPSIQTDSFGTAWKEVGEDNFTVPARSGSWGTSSESKIVYTGDHGLRWDEYPDGWGCSTKTFGGVFYRHCYRPAKVLSVHAGVLDFYLHNCRYPDGVVASCGADPGPVIPTTGSRYQRYGRYDVRFKVVFDHGRHLDQYHIAWLLYPRSEPAQPCAESDFPEMSLNASIVHAFAHDCNGTDRFSSSIDLTKWHTFVQEWGPGYRRYYLDGKLLGQSTNAVYSKPERWQLQTQVYGTGGATSGHLLLDWVWIGAPIIHVLRTAP